MRTQDIFRKVLRGHYYGRRTPYMCHALDNALCDGAISSQEHAQATAAIDKYLLQLRAIHGGTTTSVMSVALRLAFGSAGRPVCQDDWPAHRGIRLYHNWDKRPKG